MSGRAKPLERYLRVLLLLSTTYLCALLIRSFANSLVFNTFLVVSLFST